jgi:hypothetical protein
MQLKTILNRVQKFKSFVYTAARFAGEVLEVQVAARANGKALCSGCARPSPGYDRLPERRFEFVPLWGIRVFLVYAPRRVDCRRCGVRVEQMPWASGKHQLTETYAWFLARWARRLSWKEVAEVFHTSWENVFRSVEMAVTWGREHMSREGIRAIGIDEIAWQRGHKYLTLVYQIDAHCKRLLWIGEHRKVKTLLRFFRWLGKERSGALSSDIQIYELRRHPVLRVRGSGMGSLPRHSQRLFQVAEPVAAPLDVEDVGAVQEPVEDRGREHLVAGQQFGPVAHALVRGDQDRATPVAVGHEPEEQAGLLAVHRLEAELIDHQQGSREVLAPAQLRGRERGVAAQLVQQLVEAEVLHRETLLDRLHAKPDGEMGLADPGRTLDQHRLGPAHPGAGGERFDARALDRRLEGEIEVGECLPGRETREPQCRLHPARFPPRALGAEQRLEELVRGDGFAHRLGEQRVELFGGMDATELDQLLAGTIDIEFLSGRAHRAPSSNRA